MAQVSPIIQDGILTDLREGSPVQIVVDSAALKLQTACVSASSLRAVCSK